MKTFLAPALLGLTLLAAPALANDGCSADQVFVAGDLSISGAFSRATLPQAKVAGGYLTITNNGTTSDRLLGGSSDGAKAVQVHQMQMVGDMMKMSQVEGGLEIPAGGSVTLDPGGYHLMLMDIAQPLETDECLALTLKFEKAGEVPVVLTIGASNADAAPAGHQGH